LILHPVFIILLLAGCNAYASGHISIRHAWIADAPGSTATRSAYFDIENHGSEAVSLMEVSSPVFARTEMHRSIDENGMARMERQSGVEIRPAGRLQFMPGGLHLMLYNATKAPQPGDRVPLRFAFSDGTALEAHAQVRKPADVHQQHVSQSEETKTGMISVIKTYYQHLLPQHWLSGIMHRLTRIRWEPLKHLMIGSFIKAFDVDMSIAAQPDPAAYSHFNDFFTRALKPGARPIDYGTDNIVSPVDGIISQAGVITEGKIIQAKGKFYSLQALLGGDRDMAARFVDGHYVTMYLSPRDYHRIHMPVSGTLKSMTYVPGDLFSVNPATTEAIDNLFARNERVIHIFDTEIGPARSFRPRIASCR
jgi:phosphatidylserine decarboxylase/copper(I)-binding protein